MSATDHPICTERTPLPREEHNKIHICTVYGVNEEPSVQCTRIRHLVFQQYIFFIHQTSHLARLYEPTGTLRSSWLRSVSTPHSFFAPPNISRVERSVRLPERTEGLCTIIFKHKKTYARRIERDDPAAGDGASIVGSNGTRRRQPHLMMTIRFICQSQTVFKFRARLASRFFERTRELELIDRRVQLFRDTEVFTVHDAHWLQPAPKKDP
ncbi:uncharacterized protein BT62DRAFT_1004151 [Guyanagaster necrorhizus]|uniref:Uncharacterized protein n=1 Tax=Guyanagaster necrorhizus TaxID=856835 RepID=A0A9P7VWS9_9AGAR|nr:uncharacterized protein BT62DRAFT_1004151 [Guyanagaster necrorhizus MCA 3950]KAG7448352.1 hypothetical protein BT62DRAFT_1004151 [Guyanagaster necrorhizus MCA 3950]